MLRDLRWPSTIRAGLGLGAARFTMTFMASSVPLEVPGSVSVTTPSKAFMNALSWLLLMRNSGDRHRIQAAFAATSLGAGVRARVRPFASKRLL